MKLKKVIITIAVALLVVLVVSLAVAQGWSLPSTFTINPNFAGLPIPQPNQTIFGCKYAFPIQLRDVKVYDYSLQGQNLNLNASFGLYTDNKKSTCSVRQRIFTIQLSNWENNLASYIVSNSSGSIGTLIPPNPPISIGGST